MHTSLLLEFLTQRLLFLGSPGLEELGRYDWGVGLVALEGLFEEGVLEALGG
jgi:hypothetical protein